jgi:hypothetical protein
MTTLSPDAPDAPAAPAGGGGGGGGGGVGGVGGGGCIPQTDGPGDDVSPQVLDLYNQIVSVRSDRHASGFRPGFFFVMEYQDEKGICTLVELRHDVRVR